MRQPRQPDAPPPASLSRRQARQLTETAYLAAATALLWVGLYYLPVGGALFRLALPLPLALLQLRQNWRCGVEGVTVAALLLVALMGPIRGPLVLFPYGLLALWLGWWWTRRHAHGREPLPDGECASRPPPCPAHAHSSTDSTRGKR